MAIAIIVLATSCSNTRIFNNSFSSKDTAFTKEMVLRLAPGENNPRNSEGSFVTLKSGRILFIYSRYTGNSSHDHASAYLASRYSDDGGKTWHRFDRGMEVSGYHHNVRGGFLMLRPGLYSAGQGTARFRLNGVDLDVNVKEPA